MFTSESSVPTVDAITMACSNLHNIGIVREVTYKYEWILARKDIHTLDNSEENGVDVVERNLAGATDAKEIRKALDLTNVKLLWFHNAYPRIML